LAEVPDIETFVIDPDQGLYRLYVPYAPQSQVLRYEPTADGGGFSLPAPYFVGEGEDVSAFLQLYIDGDVYAVTEPEVIRYFNGRASGYSLDAAPDNANLRPGHQYRILAATGTRGVGEIFVWDALWSRILVYDKAGGTYSEQYHAAESAPSLADVRGMYVIDRGNVLPPILVWALANGVYQVELTPTDETPSSSPGPDASPSAPVDASPQPGASPTPRATPLTSSPPGTASPPAESAPPTERPRRTPRAGAASPTPEAAD
jgi:hypothetical protein